MTSATCEFFEFDLSTSDPADIVQQSLASTSLRVINTLNAHSFNVALQDEEFHDALMASDFLTADGVGVVWAAKALGAGKLRKVAGFDLFAAAMHEADTQGLTVGFFGSTPEVLATISSKTGIDYPGATVRVLSPPFVSTFSSSDAARLLGELGKVDILFVGMTAPKQEKFVHQARDHISARMVLSIGAVFDFYSGSTKRPHPVFVKLGLEWLGRSIADPKKLGKRNLIAIPKFMINFIKKTARREHRSSG